LIDGDACPRIAQQLEWLRREDIGQLIVSFWEYKLETISKVVPKRLIFLNPSTRSRLLR